MAKCAYAPATFRQQVIIQSGSRLSDGQGGFSEEWTDGATVWASIEPVKAYERYQAMQTQTPVTHRIAMRYRADVTSSSRLLYGDRVFWVKEVIDEEFNNRFLTIRAIERAAAAAEWGGLSSNWESITTNWESLA